MSRDPDEVEDEDDQDTSVEDTETLRQVEPITYFGTDFDVHGLVRRLTQNDIKIPSFDPEVDSAGNLAGFQRKFVWKGLQMERFVESLLLGFPVPGIFLVQQKDKSLLVLDGQQRLRTLQKFFVGDFELESVADEFKGLKYGTLDEEQRRTLDNVFIHATVIKYANTATGANSIYSIFERLNSGGTNLHPHEIRVALYNGALVGLIRDLNRIQPWRTLYGPVNPRLRDHELILRFIAFYLEAKNYERPLKSFLNTFMFNHRNAIGIDEKRISSVFHSTCTAIEVGIGRQAFRTTSSINSALVDAVMIGVARRLDKQDKLDPRKLKPAFDKLIEDRNFIDAIARATANEERVRTRLEKATEAFSNL